MMNRQTAVIEMIADGDFDDHLSALAEALVARRKMIALNAGMRIQTGARVRFNADALPEGRTGWAGVEGVIEGKTRDGTKVKVKLDLKGQLAIMVGPRRSAKQGQVWTIPAEWVEVIG